MATKIPWCDEVLNVTAGCTKCSPGCLNCYAERMAKRQVAMGCTRGGDNTAAWVAYSDAINPETGKWSGDLALRYDQLDKPLHWKKPRRIFIDSMSDLFHPKVPFEFIDKVHAAMIMAVRNGRYHTYLILTKRIKRMLKYYASNRRPQLFKILEKDYDEFTGFFGINWPFPNLHLGVSISNPDELWKVDELKKIPAAVRWLSIEPMLAGIEFAYDHLFCDRDPEEDSPIACVPCRCGKHWENSPISGTTLNCIDWVVCGGESGPGARPMHLDWPRNIRDQCVAAGVSFYFKQWGEWLSGEDKYALKINTYQGYYPKRVTRIENINYFRVGRKLAGDLLDGRKWKQLPK